MIGKITAVTVAGDAALEVRWDDGATGLVDLASLIATRANLAPLRDPAAFAQARLADDGWSVEWPTGIDFGASQLRVWAKLRLPVRAGS